MWTSLLTCSFCSDFSFLNHHQTGKGIGPLGCQTSNHQDIPGPLQEQRREPSRGLLNPLMEICGFQETILPVWRQIFGLKTEGKGWNDSTVGEGARLPYTCEGARRGWGDLNIKGRDPKYMCQLLAPECSRGVCGTRTELMPLKSPSSVVSSESTEPNIEATELVQELRQLCFLSAKPGSIRRIRYGSPSWALNQEEAEHCWVESLHPVNNVSL